MSRRPVHDGPNDFDDDVRLAHELRLEPDIFQTIVEGARTALLVVDEWYAVDELLVLREWCASRKRFTGRWLARVVTHVSRRDPGVAKGFVQLSLGLVDAKPVHILRPPIPTVMSDEPRESEG